jgi:hypothetical protein
VHARPKAKKRSFVHRYVRQGHHRRGLSPHACGETGSSIDASDCFRPSHVLEMTESRFSSFAFTLDWPTGPLQEGRIGSPEVLSDVRQVGEWSRLAKLDDVVKLEAVTGTIRFSGVSVASLRKFSSDFLDLFLFLLLFLPMIPMRRCSSMMRFRIYSCYAVVQESRC